jgi:transaldolase
MKPNPLIELEELGQCIWLDYIQRGLVKNGQLKRMIKEDGLSGMTSNPAIFEKAILDSHDYDAEIRTLALAGRDAKAIFDTLSVRDVQTAADSFRPLYDRTSGAKGYVSLEVNPHLAHDTRGTIEEAHRLWITLARPNVLIKIPATDEGLPAIRQIISDGINVNVTLLFGLTRYRQALEAYLSGIEYRLGQGKPVEDVASVASFFVSRMDTMVDPLLEQFIAQGNAKAELAKKLRGRVAVANSKAAYGIYKEAFSSERFARLAQRGARKQWLLWASTSTKVPEYSDVKYIDELIGPDTINTVPIKTLDAYRDHGDPQVRIERDMETSNWVLAQLPELGIDLDHVTQQLENEGDAKFTEPYDHLIETLTKSLPK